jgi:hypothetical protein
MTEKGFYRPPKSREGECCKCEMFLASCKPNT